MANSANLLIPTPLLSAIGWVNNAKLSGTVGLTLPVPIFTCAGQTGAQPAVTLTLPTPTFSCRGFVTSVGQVLLTLPVPTLECRGFVALEGTVSLVMPTPAIRIYSPSNIALALPAPVFVVRGFTGRVGTVQLVLPTPQFEGSGKIPFVADAPLVLPVPKLAVSGTVGNVGYVSNALRGIALAMEGYTGTIGTCNLVLPVNPDLANDFEGGLSITGYQNMRGTVALQLPMLVLQATGYASDADTADPDGNVLPAIVMQTETRMLWQYTNWPFNSMAKFNGVYLGASAEGLFVLAGDTDNGAMIQAAARVGISDFGTSFLKRIDKCYVGLRADGDMVIRVLTDQVNVRDYLITKYGQEGLHGNHTRIGRGVEARYWQFEIRNTLGCRFEFDAIELKPVRLRRRIGGGDA